MKKTTKILSLILSVLTLLSVFSAATPVFAEEITEITSGSTENVDDMTVSSEETETEEAEIVSEIEDMRTEYTKYFRMSDGSYMAAQYAQPVHFKENGEWKEYDYSITKEESTNDFVIENSDNEMSFPEEFSEDDAQIEVSAREYDIKFSPVLDKKIFKNTEKQKGKVKDHKELKSNKIIEDFTEEAPIDESADKNAEKLKIDNQKSAIAYEEVYDNIDLEYEISSNQIKESIVLNSKQDKNKFEFTVDTDGLFPKKETDGSITLYEDKECTKPVSSIMKPFMYDANGEYSYDVTMDIKEKKGVYILTVKADNNWLNDKARKYPVVIDPSITLDVGRTNTTDCYADNSQPNTAFPYDYYIYAGHSSLGKTRAFVKFKLPDIPDKCSVITSASIHYIQKSADVSSSTGYLNIYNVTSDWKNTSLTWNKQPSVDKSLVLDYAKIVFGANVVYSFDITKTVKAWYQGETNYGLMLASANESVVNRAQLYSSQNYAGDAYPQITVTYRNNKGIEDYWSYSSYSNDTAGAAYINDYSGNLVYELPILSSISEIAPLTLTAIFNNYCANTKFSAGKSGSSKTTPGKGFRLNVQQTLLESAEYNLKGEDKTKYPYVYTDADGTEHYIQKVTEDGKTVYKDEDGLGLTLITKSSGSYKYRLNDKSGNLWYFNDQGNLFCQKDNNGNEIRIYFKDGASNFENNQIIDYIKDGAGHTFKFDYYTTDGLYNGYIKSITDNANRTINFTTTSGLLRKITYSDSTYTNIVYEGDESEGLINYIQGFNGYALNFDYTSKKTGRQVKTVKEFGRDADGVNVPGQIVTFDRTTYNKTVIRTAGIDGIHYAQNDANGADDIVTTLQFDNEGKTISQQVSYGSGGEIGAGNASYTSGASTLGSANKVSSNASLGKNTVNLLVNGNAENLNNWTAKASTTVTASHYVTGADSYMGKNAIAIKNTDFSDSGVGYYRQNINKPTVDKTYTLSAYVRVGALTEKYKTTHKGVHLQLTAYNSSGTALKTEYSEKITAKTDTTVNNGWRRITVSIKIPANTTTLSSYLCLRDVTGTVYFDCIQLELGGSANSYNMLENSSFENSTSDKPDSWSEAGAFTISKNSNGTVLDGSSEGRKKNGKKSLIISGAPDKGKGMSQKVAVKANENDTYIVSGWAFGYAVNTSCHTVTPLFEILARVYYTRTDSAGTKTTVYQDKTTAKFNTTISEWQYSSASFALKYTKPDSGCTYTPTHIVVMPRYCYQENHAYFDHIQLIKDAGQTHTYTYDEDGNVVSTAVNTEQKVNTKYDDNNNLTEYTDIAGYKTTATYDDKHNLLTTKSAKGVVTNNSYNSNGTIKSTEIQNSGNTTAIKTAQEYHNANPDKGIKAGAYLKYTYDEHGNETKYHCTWESGIRTQRFFANGATTTYGYNNSIKSRLTNVTHEGTKVNYTYITDKNGVASDRISNILYTGTADNSPSESYSFEYDSYGNVTKTKVGNQVLATNTYADNNGALLTTTYGNNDKETKTYNNLGLVSKITTVNDGKSKTSYSWGYNGAGGTVYHRDAENNLKYLYDYDSLGRLIRQEIQTNDTFAHVGSTEVTYDIRNNVTKIATEFGGHSAVDEYLYSKNAGALEAADCAKDNLISRYKINGSSTRYIDYYYDDLNRLEDKELNLKNNVVLLSSYKYYDSDRGSKYTTTQLESEALDNTKYSYYYDKVGNITRVETRDTLEDFILEENYRNYEYDSKNQLTKEHNASSGITTSIEYDCLGNISKKSLSGKEEKTITYVYDKDSHNSWNNLLVEIKTTPKDGTTTTQTIEYDEIGNPTKYLGASLDWYGRQLTSYTKGTTSVKYTYDADGLRGTKTVTENKVDTKHTYHYVSGQLRYEERGKAKFYYFYDSNGNLSAIRYYNADGKLYEYFALTNAQGDVISFYTDSCDCVVTYEYDAWGNIVKTTDTTSINFAELNPIRYRGYYYDSETGLYYLQSRYYNPQVGRFLNADNQLNNDILGLNTFSYCSNNPISNIDPTGHDWYHWAIAAGVVAGLAIATVATAGTFAFGMTALGFATMGISVGGTTGALALATVGSATVLAATATFSALTSNTVEDFNNKGNWGTVGMTMMGGVIPPLTTYSSSKPHSTVQHTKGMGSPNKNVNPGGSYTKIDNNGYIYSYTQFDSQGRQSLRMDFQGKPHNGALPHTHIYLYNEKGGRAEYVFDLDWNLVN